MNPGYFKTKKKKRCSKAVYTNIMLRKIVVPKRNKQYDAMVINFKSDKITTCCLGIHTYIIKVQMYTLE